MQTTIYVDVLLVLNYVVTALLLEAAAKLLGRDMPRYRMILATLFGAFCSLSIFLPFRGFLPMMILRLFFSAAIVQIAFGGRGFAGFAKAWGVFFAVNFFFAGVMLGIWMVLAPPGMVFYNGVVYYNIDPLMLLGCTVAAYLLLGVSRRFSRSGRLLGSHCGVTLERKGRKVFLETLIDSGNSLYEPFSGSPVIVCALSGVTPLLEQDIIKALRKEDWESAGLRAGLGLRMVPFEAVGGKGMLPALKLDSLTAEQYGRVLRTERVYMAISREQVGTDGCKAILNPDLAVSDTATGNFHRKV